jgi:hypothetical protein
MNVMKYLELMNLLRKLPPSAARVEGPVLNGQRTLNERLAETASPDRVQRDASSTKAPTATTRSFDRIAGVDWLRIVSATPHRL